MGIFDKIKDAAGDNADKIDAGIETGIDKVGDAVDAKTGGKFAGQVDQAQDFAKGQADARLGNILANDKGAVPPVEGESHAENLPGDDVLDALADNPPPQG